MKQPQFLTKYLYSILIIILITTLSLMKTDSLNRGFLFNIPHLDKIVHIGMYFTLTFILIIENGNKNEVKLTLLTVLFGGVMELSQLFFTTYRSGDYLDLLSNTLGSLLALLFTNRFYANIIALKIIERILKLKESIIQ